MRELWSELGANMRVLRTAAGMSLRQAEAVTGRGRGSLSQAENGKARPSRELVDWYDAQFDSDGLLLSLFAEARSAHGPSREARRAGNGGPPAVDPGDAMRVEDPLLASGQLVDPGSTVSAGWTLVNAGTARWSGRCLARIGARTGVRLITSETGVGIAPCAPGERVPVRVTFAVPPLEGTFAAYWQVVDAAGRPCFAPSVPLCALVTTYR